jgi:hypothetical protein
MKFKNKTKYLFNASKVPNLDDSDLKLRFKLLENMEVKKNERKRKRK